MLKLDAVKDNDSKKKLNKEQLTAVKHQKGPLLIIAGAGTGKTTVVTERIKYLITSANVKPSEILALTFTEKAAKEMQDRVYEALPYGYSDMWISTFHSFCDRILRLEALHIGLDPKYKLMSEAECVQIVRNNLFKFNLKYFRPMGNPTKFVAGMLQHFSRLQDEDTSPNEYIHWVRKQKEKNKKLSEEARIELEKWEELSGAYKTYNEIKIKEALMDFGDLIVKTLELFKARKNILKIYRDKFKYILVDEFQDTNFVQNELAIILSGKSKNITVCGDDDQSIYRFRGAAVSNIIQFKKNFPRAKVVVLTKNYRSTQEILDKAHDLIKFNDPDRLEAVEKIDKKLIASSKGKTKGDKIEFIHRDRVENEADEVAKKIKEIVKQNKYDFNDFAILVRANNHAEPFGRAMSRLGIPYQFLGPGRLFKQAEIIDLISYLKVLYNFDDSVSFYRLLSIDYFDISARDLAAIGNYARRFNLTFYETCRKVDDIFIGLKTKEKIKKILDIIDKHIRLAKKETAGQILYYFLRDSGLMQKLINPDSSEAQKKAANISKFFDRLKTYEVDHEDATVSAVVDWIELSSELGESPLAADTDWTEVNAVNILTAHSSKGLEFPVVFLVNLVSNRFPTVERREQIPIPDKFIKEVLPLGDYHLEEERRLFYVGMTRAKDLLFFTAADYYGEGKREKRLSPFIFEALGDEVLSSEQLTIKSKQLSFLDYKPQRSGILPTVPTTGYKPSIHIDYLSYSQIETFRICPLHYKLKYIYKIPTLPSAPLSFGTSIHTALRDFYRLIKIDEKPSVKFLLSLLEKNWIREGYKDKHEEKKNYGRGRKYLSDYFQKSFDRKVNVNSVEESFTISLLSKNSNDKPLKIGGRIDRVDILPNGKIELIDYKTGEKLPTQKEIDKNKDISRQLAFYALAAVNLPETPFKKKPEDVILSFYFFEKQTKISTVRTKEQLEEAKEEIFKVRKEIEASDFRCSGNMLCRNCEYKMLCNVEE